VASIEIDDRTRDMIRFAAKVAGIGESDVVARAVEAYCRAPSEAEPPPRDLWTEVAVYARYQGTRVEGRFLPATRRLTVTTEPLKGRAFNSPSGAAAAVVAAVNPDRNTIHTNGWTFWRVTATDAPLVALR
jgi:hypothetical protein